MRADIVVDLQFGSTGKGAVCAFLAKERSVRYNSSIRVQSIQAGHTVYYGGNAYKMRTIPCAWVDPDVELLLGPGCFIDKALLMREIEMVRKATGKDPRDRLFLDYRAFYVTPEDEKEEVDRAIERGMGSTAHGAGSSLIRKLWRTDFKDGNGRVCDDSWTGLAGIRVCDTIARMQKQRVLVEGCQGTMLSIHTSPYYPYVTTREATASGIAAEAGISPRDVDQIFGVFRTLPIRVGGNSGPTGSKELTWDEVNERAGRVVEPERTTVTNRVRRIFEFDDSDFTHALRVNKPTGLFMTFADYLSPGIYGKTAMRDVLPDALQKIVDFKGRVERLDSSAPVLWIGTGEQAEHYIRTGR
jgi:adenylosuccinate synthase